jgi:hypothetical protein
MTTWLKLMLAVLIAAMALGIAHWLEPPRAPRLEPPAPSAAQLVPSSEREVERDAGGPAVVPPQPNPMSDALCPQGMVWVTGTYCVAGFQSERGCRVPPAEVGVCMDAFEYPNQVGVLPAVMATFDEAEQACEVEGKRLCSDAEWTLGCRGTLELSACAFGTGGPEVSRERLWEPSHTESEVARVDARRHSSETLCVSSSAAFDLPGNVEEWVRGQAKGYGAVLKGGHFNKGSIGCERSVYSHHLDTRSPFIGFRCCREPLVSPPASSF